MKKIVNFLFIILLFFAQPLLGQSDVSFSSRLHRIDSVVNSANTYGALDEVGPFYLEYIKIDSTSSNFKKLGREYIFILEKSELNAKAIGLAHSILLRNLDDPKFEAELLILLARIQEKLGNGEIAKSRLLEARKLLTNASNDSLNMVWAIRYSSYHRIFENKDTAIFFAQRAYNIAEQINQPLHQATASFLLAFLSDSIDFQEERIIFSKNIFKKNTDISGTAGMCMALRRLYLLKGDTLKAQFYLDTIGTFIKNTPYLTTKLSYYSKLKDNFREKGQLDSALTYYDSVLVLSEVLRQKQDRIQLLSSDLVFDNQRLTNNISEKEVFILNEQKEKSLLVAFFTVSILLLIVIVLLSYNQSKKQRIIQHQKSLLRKRNAELNLAMEKNNALLMELNHRVKNNLATLSGLLLLQASKSDNVKVKEQLNSSINRINTLSEIYKRALDNENLEFSDSKEVVETICVAQFQLSGRSASNLKLTIDSFELKPNDVTPLVLALNELLTNALKYSAKDSDILVELCLIDNEVSCVVVNNGLGIPEDFSIENSHSAGLYIVKILVQQLNGKLYWKQIDHTFKIGFNFQL